MTSKYKKYSSYKDSGVEWLGEIPEHWDIRRFKTLFNEINERNKDSKGELLSVSQYTGVTKKSNNIEDGDLLSRASSLDDYKKVYKNDLVTNIMLAWNGSLGFSPFDGITSPAYSVYRLKKGNDTRFFHYLVRTEIYKSVFKRNSTGVIESRLRLYTDDFYNISSILPPLQEQTAIANFLDDKTSKIDTAIAQKKQMIALLKERKQIVIQNAVTGKWSMVDGKWAETPKEKMKDSGVEWIGEIPEEWEVKKLKYILKIKNGQEYKHVAANKGYPVIGSGGPFSFASEYLYDGEALLLGRKGTIDKPLYVNEKFWTVDTMFYAIVNTSYSTKYIYYLSQTIPFKFYSTSTALPSMTQDVLNNHKVAIPSLEEQLEVTEYLDFELDKYENAISLQQTQIEKLKEYKATLIDGAVTGKIRVSD